MIEVGDSYIAPNGNMYLRVSPSYEVYLGNIDQNRIPEGSFLKFTECKEAEPLSHEDLTFLLRQRTR